MAHEILTLIAEDHDNFIHILADRHTGEAMVVDPAWDAEGIREVLAEEGLMLTGILITHSHHDHVNAVRELYGERITLFISEAEQPHWPDCPEDAVLVNDGDEISFGGSSIGVIMTPGHTPGSCCYRLGGDLICGDTLSVQLNADPAAFGTLPANAYNFLHPHTVLADPSRKDDWWRQWIHIKRNLF